MKTPKIIYHYCSLEAFYSIITNKSFRLFSLSSSKDLKEMSEAKRMLRKIMKEEKYKSFNKLYTNESDEFYYLSCTDKKDSALHFSKYADNDKGVCIGIDTEVFQKYLLKFLPTNSYFSYFSFLEIFYDDEQKEKEIKTYLDGRLLFINQPKKVNAKEFFELIMSSKKERHKPTLRWLAYTTALSRFEPKMKIANYKDESEVRMLFCRDQFNYYKSFFENRVSTDNFTAKENTEKENDSKTSLNNLYNTSIKPAEELNFNSSPQFKVISGTLRKYMELKMEAIWNEHPIKEMVLGPNCNTDIEEFNEFLKANDVSCKAIKSNIMNRS
jgi:hypothetical protein